MWWEDIRLEPGPVCRAGLHQLDLPAIEAWTLVISQGPVLVRIGRSSMVLGGCVFWRIAPGVRARCAPGPGGAPWRLRAVRVSGATADAWAGVGLFPEDRQEIRDPSLVEPTLIRALAQAARPGAWAGAVGASTLQTMLLVLRASRDGVREPAWFRELLAVLNHHRVGGVDLAAIASGLGWSAATLRRRFQALAGMSLRDWMVRSRMTRAQQALTDSHASVATIAAGLGYRSRAHFNRHFLAHVGRAPGTGRDQGRPLSPART
jgi:AraC-like DNA-binding protein